MCTYIPSASASEILYLVSRLCEVNGVVVYVRRQGAPTWIGASSCFLSASSSALDLPCGAG